MKRRINWVRTFVFGGLTVATLLVLIGGFRIKADEAQATSFIIGGILLYLMIAVSSLLWRDYIDNVPFVD